MNNLRFVLIFILFFILRPLSGQDIYYDSAWVKTSKENAKYYRIIDTISKDNFFARDFYLNGQLQMQGYYVNLDKNIKNGKFSWYSDTGIKTKDCSYTLGKLDGHYIGWYNNGKIKVEGKYKLDKKDSLWSWYDTNGVINSSGEFDNGISIGTWTRYYSDGSKQEQFEMKNNKFSGQAIVWDSTGTLKGEIYLDQKLKNGNIKVYYPNGKMLAEGKFKNKKAEGTWIAYHSNGKKRGEGLVSKGYLSGSWNYYDENGIIEKMVIYDKKNAVKFPVDLKMVQQMINGS